MNEELLKQLLANIQNSNVSQQVVPQGSQLLAQSSTPQASAGQQFTDTVNKGLTTAGVVNPILGAAGLALQVIGGIRASKAAKERQKESDRQNYITNVIGRLK